MITGKMRSKGLQAVLVSFLLVLGVLSFGSSAFSFQYVLSFGDSLTDNGAFTNPDGYFGLTDTYGFDRFTDDGYYIWAEYLADNLKEPLFDMAFGGATTGDDPYNLQWQVDLYTALYSSYVTKNTLVTVWAGGNDATMNLTLLLYNIIDYPQFIQSAYYAANNEASTIIELSDAGFRKFLVLTVPDVGQTPRFLSYPSYMSVLATTWCEAFNEQLKANLNDLRVQWKGTGSTIYLLDSFELLHEVQANPSAYSKYGINSYDDVFWYDGFHPSGKTHILLGDIACKTVKTAH